MNPLFIQLIGVIAPALFVYAYAMVSLGRWPSTALKFHVLNFLGGGLILLSLTVQWNLPIFVMEICWCSISLYGVVKTLRTKRRKQPV